MNPQLIILSGSLESETILLNDFESLTIGRAEKNQLPIPDQGLSREHAIIQKTSDGYRIKDLGSRNGTFVNETPAQNMLLRHGDKIRVGQTYILFLINDDDSLIFSNNIEFDEDIHLTQSFFTTSLEVAGNDISADLSILTEIGKILEEIDSSTELQKKLLKITLDIIPADRVALVLLDEDFILPKTVCVLEKIKFGNSPMHISRSVTNFVLQNKTAVLKNDILISSVDNSESLLKSGVNSVLCVPLMLGDISGLIYLDSKNILFKFENQHLQQMTAIANLIVAALKNMRHLESLKVENESLLNLANIETKMVGESEPIKKIERLISKVSTTDATVLISGESGTGKELVARAIHKNSPRSNKPFITLNCAMLDETFLGSDLFGHEKGAFTGAISQRQGKIEQAEDGTLFLDEIGELALPLQAKLLRVLQEREFERIGGNKMIPANIRLIVATNRNLAEEVKNGNFREDLFFRLNVIEINVPPLRLRKSDIPLLAQHFTHKYSEQCKRKVIGISREAMQALVNHEWRGNIRELENTVERAVVLGSTETIIPDDLPYEIIENEQPEHISKLNFHQKVKVAKCSIILRAIESAEGNYAEAARQLGIHPNNLHRMVRELEIKEKAQKLI